MKLLIKYNPTFVKDLVNGHVTLHYMSADLVTLEELSLDNIEQEYDYYGTVTGTYFCNLSEEEQYHEVARSIESIYISGAIATVVEDKYAEYLYSNYIDKIQSLQDKIDNKYAAIGKVTY